MKLFTKISLIVAVIALGLGILGVCVGMAMGADAGDLSELGIYISPHQQVKVSGAITEIEEEIKEKASDVVEESFQVYQDDGIGHHRNETQNNYRLHDENMYEHSHSLKDIDRLDIEVRNAEITILATEDVDHILYYSNKDKNIAKVDGSTLKLEDRTSSKNKIQLELYIPVGVLKEIDIDVAAGTIVADKIVADGVTFDIDAAALQIGELQVTREADLQVDAGEMVIGYYDGPKLDVECALGSIMVVCEGNQSDYNYEMECGMGRIVFNRETYSGLGEEIHINNGSSKLIEASCDMGEIVLEFPNSL